MSHRVIFAGSAIADLENMYESLRPVAGELTARRYVDRLCDYCQRFSLFPERETRRDDVSQGLRVIGYRRRATIAFLVEGEAVIIVRVFGKGCDYESDLKAKSRA